MISNEVLIRLKDCENENGMIAAFHTEKPSEFLKMYLVMKKEEIPIIYNEIIGVIKEIEISFGDFEKYSASVYKSIFLRSEQSMNI